MNAQNVNSMVIVKKSNGVGMAGFILALITLFVGWIPILGQIGWLSGLIGIILSVIGVFKRPRGFAIAGIIISLVSLLFLGIGTIFSMAALLY